MESGREEMSENKTWQRPEFFLNWRHQGTDSRKPPQKSLMHITKQKLRICRKQTTPRKNMERCPSDRTRGTLLSTEARSPVKGFQAHAGDGTAGRAVQQCGWLEPGPLCWSLGRGDTSAAKNPALTKNRVLNNTGLQESPLIAARVEKPLKK